jgi:hypothetical protein
VQQFDFQSQFSTSKTIGTFLTFLLNDKNLEAHLLLLNVFDIINFEITLFSKMMHKF